MRRTPALSAALIASLWACDPQADSKYLGEPLVTLRGQVTSSTPLPALEAAMLWQRGAPPSTNDQELATRAPVQTGFPASFTVHLYQPPPARARRTLAPGEVTFARANAGAVPPGVAEEAGVAPAAGPAGGSGGAFGGTVGYGIDALHWVVYLESDVPPQSLTAWWLGTPLKAGRARGADTTSISVRAHTKSSSPMPYRAIAFISVAPRLPRLRINEPRR